MTSTFKGQRVNAPKQGLFQIFSNQNKGYLKSGSYNDLYLNYIYIYIYVYCIYIYILYLHIYTTYIYTY